jgi:ABC-type uncharacterized transport system permease subunit
MDQEPTAFLARGAVGMSATILGVLTSFQEHLEWAVRISASLVGLAIGVLTLVSMVKKLVKVKHITKKHDRHDD